VSGSSPVVEALTSRLPVVAVQSTLKVVWAAPPPSIMVVRGFCPSTEQLGWMPESSTECSSSERLEKVTEPLTLSSFEVDPSTVAVYPSESWSFPVVEAVTFRVPV
jgi:hypothetical protein